LRITPSLSQMNLLSLPGKNLGDRHGQPRTV
jgi:hypothetical protein